ncbi:MAG: hypothetical protein ABL895_03575 [Cyclobacteriaceae bacterium]
MDNHARLTTYLHKIVSDRRLKPVHLSLSLAICDTWINNHFDQPFRISRSELMRASRIRSYATYHKTLKELQKTGYLTYTPSYHPVKASSVCLLNESASTPL